MTHQEIIAAHLKKQAEVLAALRKGVDGHQDGMPINVQCGDIRTVIALLDETKAHADDMARELAGNRTPSPE